VTVVVPFPAGGNTDIVARILTKRLTEKLGQPFVVDNRGGASGAIAAANVAQAPADGYTLLFGSTPQIAIVPFVQKVTYDPAKDLVPTSIFGVGTFVLGISSALPRTTSPSSSPMPRRGPASSATAPAATRRSPAWAAPC
jgi:tripartite-type tricarboxylate transporter receptor subunit TctC